MTEATLDAPVKGPTFHPISTSRKIKNRVAHPCSSRRRS